VSVRLDRAGAGEVTVGRAVGFAWLEGVEAELVAAGRAVVLAGCAAALAGAGWLAPGLEPLAAAAGWAGVDLAGAAKGAAALAGAGLLAGLLDASGAFGPRGGAGGGVVALMTAPVDSRARKVVMNRLWKLRRLCGPIAKDSSNVWKRECGADKLSAPHLEWRHQCLGSQKILNMNNNCFVQDPAT